MLGVVCLRFTPGNGDFHPCRLFCPLARPPANTGGTLRMSMIVA